jgi:transcription termination factor NusB
LSRGLEGWRFAGLRNWRNLSEAGTGRGEQQNRSIHGVDNGVDANRYEIAGQFASALRRRKVSAELDMTRDLILRVSCFETLHSPGS